MTSIRHRLIWGGIFTIVSVLAVVGTLSFSVIQHEADEVFSARLATSARVLETMTARQLEKATLNSPLIIELPQELESTSTGSNDEMTVHGHPYENKLAFQVWSDNTKQLLAMSASAPSQPLGPFEPGFHDFVESDTSSWHVFTLKSGDIWILTAEKSEVRQEMVMDLALSVLSPLLFGSLLLIVIFHFVARYSLKPLHQITLQIEKKQASDWTPFVSDTSVSEVKSLQTAINRWLGQLRSARNREQEFIRAAAHEIRTPIAAIQLHVQNAKQGSNIEEISTSLLEAEEATRRTAKLADQLLTLNRLSASGESVFSDLKTPIADAIQNVVNWIRPLLAPKNLQVLTNMDREITSHIQTHLIERLVRNLLENAAQYGMSPGTIHIGLSRTNFGFKLTVENDGPCIPDEEKSKVFIPYYRCNSNSIAGSGLGLAIVEEMVRQMNGKVWIEDKEPGKGVRVAIQIKD